MAKKPSVAFHARTALLSSAPPPPTAALAFTKILEALEVLQVTRCSLAYQEIGQEQAAIRCAERALWISHDYLFALQTGSDTCDEDAGHDE